jgi:hypothetical protein
MPTTLACPSCRTQLQVPDDLLGTNVQCPACGLTFQLPAGGSAQQQPPAPSPAPPANDLGQAGQVERSPGPRGGPDDYVAPRRRGYGPHEWADEEDEAERARRLLMPPAICLLVTGSLGLMADLFQVVFAFVPRPAPAADLPEFFREIQKGSSGPMAAVLGGLFAVVSVVIIVAALQMMRRRTWSLAITGSILAMGNLVNCCCLLGLPAGIYALVVLNKPEVRSTFE